MAEAPLVSIITIFLDEAQFIEEAIESVRAQSYPSWELLLVDDGSTDASTELARGYARRWPEKIRYLEHEGHANRGMSASRNLGLAHAKGRFLAFLDADDVWLERKLERQVPFLLANPGIDMIYGATEYWYGWTDREQDVRKDYVAKPIAEEASFAPPHLLPLFLSGAVLMPCIGGVLVRREAVEKTGGWEESFRGLFEDQVFFAKLCLSATIRVTNACDDRYRQHAESCCSVGIETGQVAVMRRMFLDWLAEHLVERGQHGSECWKALERERAR